MTRATLLGVSLGLSLGLSLVAACAPTQRRLLSDRQYEAALREMPGGDVDGAAVLAAIEADLQLGLHVQAIGAEAMRAQLAAAGNNIPPGLDSVVLVRVIQDSNRVEHVMFTVTLSLLHRGTLLPPVDPGQPNLAALIGEAPPGTVAHQKVDLLALLGRVPTTESAATLSSTVTNPASATLQQWLAPEPCGLSTGDRCTAYLMWPRPWQGGDLPLELAVEMHVDFNRTAILYRFALPPGSLEAGLASLFGDRMRTVQDLQRAHGRGRSVVYPLGVLRAGPDGGFTLASRRKLTRLVVGTRRRPGLRTYPGLRIVVDPTRLPGGSRAVPELRAMLLGLGLSDRQIEIRLAPGSGEGSTGILVVHDLPPLPPVGREPTAGASR